MAQTVFAPWDDPNERPLIEFRKVTKKFGDTIAIDAIDLNIYKGEFFALLGPSGCGKTTLMRMLGGFERPTEGSIMLSGQNIVHVPPNRRATNMMFQTYALFPHLSVYDNIAFGLRRETKDKAQIDARVTEMMGLVRLEKFSRRKPHQLSGGQRQRVALARSLAKAPKLLLLDEPLGALDKKLREETQFELVDIQEKTGTTFVIVTHDQEEAMTVASRVAVMDEGLIMQVDTPQRIYEAPASVYVADFVGDVNLIEGRATQDGERVMVDWAEGEPSLTGTTNKQFAKGQRCTVAIRPEKVLISAERPDRANVLRGKIIDIGYLGNVSTYHVKLPTGQVMKAQQANTSRRAAAAFTWEDDVWLGWTDTAAVLLDR